MGLRGNASIKNSSKDFQTKKFSIIFHVLERRGKRIKTIALKFRIK